jgi:3alpha(or 20beta)-hydroxysteroid dehydrogenase
MNDGRLKDKVALVTGAARGIGADVARQMVAEGARVVITDVTDDTGTALATELGAAARFSHLDVADEAHWAAAVEDAEKAFGTVNVLVNNAGITAAGSLADFPVDMWRKILDVNLTGSFLGMRAVAPRMAATGGGSIVNVSSVDGLRAIPGLHAYGASKSGLRLLTKSVAAELGPQNVRVNSVHPGLVATPMTEGAPEGFLTVPMRRAAAPSELAAMICWLASDEASYATGAEFVVDGGMTAILPYQSALTGTPGD